jgi:hypothetical protein
MYWIDLIFVVVFALILSSILSWGLGWRHPANGNAVGISFLFLFMILLFSMWAGGGWLRPWGPMVYNTPWLGLLLIGFFISLLILAIATPNRRPRTLSESKAEAQEEAAVVSAFGAFFWILIFGLLISAFIGYFV